MFKNTIKRFEPMIPSMLLVGGIVLFLAAITLSSLNHIISFSGYAANGAFQLMNPLTRLADGQAAGRDFQFFHGAGVSLVHFPLFILFGQGLFGSEMSRWLTSIIFFTLSTVFLCFAWYKNKGGNYTTLLISFAAILILSFLFAEVITPSNSLLGVRTTIPIVIAGIILFKRPLQKQWPLLKGGLRLNLYTLLISLGLAAAVLMGTEHGIASILAYVVLELLYTIFTVEKKRTALKTILSIAWRYIQNLLPIVIIGGVFLVLLSTVISLGHPAALLQYSLLTVPGDQFWYFGAEPQGYLSLSTLWSQLTHSSLHPLYIISVITAIWFYIAKRQKLLSSTQWQAVVFLILYGVATLSSLLGYFSPSGQIVGFMRALIIANVFIAAAFLLKIQIKKPVIKKMLLPSISAGLAVVLAVLSLTILSPIDIRSTAKNTLQNIKGNHNSLLSSGWSTMISEFQPFIEKSHNTQNSVLWSTYASLYERNNNLIHPSTDGFDYIIHALGSNDRNQYTQDFINLQPQLVATLRPSYFGFEEWLWGRHADFYTHLVENYTIIAQNEAHTLWQRDTIPRDNLPKNNFVEINVQNTTINLPRSSTANSRLIEVEVEYRASAPLGLTRMPRYILKPSDTVSSIGFSLPPNSSSWKFLVVLKDNDASAQLDYYADGLIPGAKLSINKVSYRPIQLDTQGLQFFTEQSVFLKNNPQ